MATFDGTCAKPARSMNRRRGALTPVSLRETSICAGTHESMRPTPDSHALSNDSCAEADRIDCSISIPMILAPVPSMISTGAPGAAQRIQATAFAAATAFTIMDRWACTTAGSTARWKSRPLLIDTRPSRTRLSSGSSMWTITSPSGTARCTRAASSLAASAAAPEISATAP